jgi:hypothetical protein
MSLATVLATSSAASSGSVRTQGNLERVLYEDEVSFSERALIAELTEMRVDNPISAKSLAPLALEVLNAIQSDLRLARPPVSCGLEQLLDGKCPARRSVVYDMVQGAKRVRLGGLSLLGPKASWDVTKTFAILPLHLGYACAQAELAFKNSSWRLSPDPIPCEKEELEAWVVGVKVENVSLPSTPRDEEKEVLRRRMQEAMYSALESLGRGKLTTYRQENQRTEESRRAASPQSQIAWATKRVTHVVRIRLH